MSERGTSDAAEIVQAAALEAIKAIRALLDIAETVVRDPGTAADVGKAFAEAAATAFRSPAAGYRAGDDDERAPVAGQRVRRIHLSD